MIGGTTFLLLSGQEGIGGDSSNPLSRRLMILETSMGEYLECHIECHIFYILTLLYCTACNFLLVFCMKFYIVLYAIFFWFLKIFCKPSTKFFNKILILAIFFNFYLYY